MNKRKYKKKNKDNQKANSQRDTVRVIHSNILRKCEEELNWILEEMKKQREFVIRK